MTFYVQKEAENDRRILIHYSCGHRPTCDGTLSYEKDGQVFTVLTLSSGASILETEKLYPGLRQLIDRQELSGGKQKIEEHPAPPEK